MTRRAVQPRSEVAFSPALLDPAPCSAGSVRGFASPGTENFSAEKELLARYVAATHPESKEVQKTWSFWLLTL